MNRHLVIAPHPDDETLGCGGTLLKLRAQGEQTNWLIITGIEESGRYSAQDAVRRQQEIQDVARVYGFENIIQLNFPTTRVDVLPLADMIEKVSQAVNEIKPEILYLPFPGDVHSDHRIVFDVMSACTKKFRFPWIKRILSYETVSETDFIINPTYSSFRPNIFVDISQYIDKKIATMKMYHGEMGSFPFPRSEETIRALALYRGSMADYKAAEAFMLLKETID